MSETPFTDSCTYGFTDEDGIHCEAVHADIARTLERELDRYKSEVEVITRERDEALNKAHNYEQGYLTHAARADTLEKERNSLEDQRDFCMGEIKRLREDYLLELQEALRATRERDEARDTARWLYQHGMATLIEGASRNEWIKEEIK